MIKKGHVTISGATVRDPGFNVEKIDYDQIMIDGHKAAIRTRVILMMNKPDGLITAMEDMRMPTIADLIADEWKKSKIFPIGRLDKDTTGLLLLTNDGILGHRLTGPRWDVWKTYRVETKGKAFTRADISSFSTGLALADGILCQPANLTIINDNCVDLAIHEGKYHQVKRMMLSTGRRVTKLHRWQIGPIILDQKLEPGQYRELTTKEISLLYDCVKLKPDHKEKGD